MYNFYYLFLILTCLCMCFYFVIFCIEFVVNEKISALFVAFFFFFCFLGGKDDDGNSIKSGSTNDMSGLSKKQRKARTAFTDHQLQTLEKSFERQKYLSVQERQELAHKLDLSDCQVKTWYQNRR